MGLAPFSLKSIRGKMVSPALSAAGAAVVAALVTVALLDRSADELAAARTRELPALFFFRDMRADLGRLDALVGSAGEEGLAERGLESEALYSGMVARLDGEGAAAVGRDEVRSLGADLKAYWEAARTDPARRAGSGRPRELYLRFQALYGRLESGARRTQLALEDVLRTAETRQRQSILVGALILLAFALGSAALALWGAGRAVRPVRVLSEAALRIAGGDLTQKISVHSEDELGVLAQSFGKMLLRLRELVSTLKSASEELAAAAEQLSLHTRAQSAMLERQAAGVAETTSTTRQLEQSSSVAASRAAAVIEVAKRAAETSQAGQEAAEKSAGELHRLAGSVESIVAQSSRLLEQTRQVGDIVETVRDLATQSHVLSLNASIEAARAGEAGKSFAVVAQEIRALSEQSGQGAARIAAMVEAILTAVESTRDLTERGSVGMAGSLDQIRASEESLREIGGIVRETSDAALHIAAAVQQQSTGIAQIATAMRDLDGGMEETIGRIRALEASAQLVAETATRISGVAAEFRL